MFSVYQVLSRKYRPTTFSDLKGQDVLVQTLTNALRLDRVAHAYLLTGIRGIGKTTTARLLARALNCVRGLDSCGACPSCVALTNESHIDVIEVDAASRTGVDDVRSLLEGLHYKPVMGRYKVYIIDEVHMLSKSAFNALLKNLEEPPAHVVFILATTETQKIPFTVLSRCQRFDLKPFTEEALINQLQSILIQEGFSADEGALKILAQGGGGSMRDALSLLDQAINLTQGKITLSAALSMLGRGNPCEMDELMELLLRGNIQEAITKARGLLDHNLAPESILEDLLTRVHDRSIKKIVGDKEALSIPVLTRAWQILLKGYGEVKKSPNPAIAFEMVLIRFTHVEEILSEDSSKPPVTLKISSSALPPDFDAVVKLFDEQKEPLLASYLFYHTYVISYVPGHLIARFDVSEEAITLQIQKCLQKWTQTPWRIDRVLEGGNSSLGQIKGEKEIQKKEELLGSPMVKNLMTAFPGGRLMES